MRAISRRAFLSGAAAATGLRKPVNVIEGNYERMAGVCPWWERARADEAAE